jgi:hypothetical protein
VQGLQTFSQVFEVMETAGWSLQGSDFVIDPFQRAGGQPVVVPAQEDATVHAQRIRHDLQLTDASGFSPLAPGLQAGVSLLVVWTIAYDLPVIPCFRNSTS